VPIRHGASGTVRTFHARRCGRLLRTAAATTLTARYKLGRRAPLLRLRADEGGLLAEPR